MPKKSSRRKRREAARRELQKLRAHPDCLDVARLGGYRRFCAFMRIWWIVYPLIFGGTLFATLLLKSWTVAVIWVCLLPLPLAVNCIRRACFEEKLACPHCDRPAVGRWYDRGVWGEGFSDIRPRRRYYRELKKATDTYTCPYCDKKIRFLPHKEYKRITENRKNRE